MSIQKNRRRLSGQEFVDRTFQGEDLRNGIAQGSRWVRCTFVECKLDGANFGDATFVECKFERCTLRQTILVSRIYWSRFHECEMDQVQLTAADIQNAQFLDCRLDYSNWDRATVQRTGINDCGMHGARLDFAETKDVDFSGSNLWGVVVPISCATFSGNRFDRRQMHMLLALLSKSIGNDSERGAIRSIVDVRYQRSVDRLVDAQVNGESGETSPDESRAVYAELDHQDSEVGDRGDSPRFVAG